MPDPSAVAQQCSSSRIPIYDPTIDVTTTSAAPLTTRDLGGIRWRVDREEPLNVLAENPTQALKLIDEPSLEGSGANGDINTTDYGKLWKKLANIFDSDP